MVDTAVENKTPPNVGTGRRTAVESGPAQWRWLRGGLPDVLTGTAAIAESLGRLVKLVSRSQQLALDIRTRRSKEDRMTLTLGATGIGFFV